MMRTRERVVVVQQQQMGGSGGSNSELPQKGGAPKNYSRRVFSGGACRRLPGLRIPGLPHRIAWVRRSRACIQAGRPMLGAMRGIATLIEYLKPVKPQMRASYEPAGLSSTTCRHAQDGK